MSENQQFASSDDLKQFLVTVGLMEAKAHEAAPLLFDKGYDEPDALYGTTSANLKESGLSIALAQTLSNKLAKQQQNGKLGCCSRIVVFSL
jgi:hypothetical protein